MAARERASLSIEKRELLLLVVAAPGTVLVDRQETRALAAAHAHLGLEHVVLGAGTVSRHRRGVDEEDRHPPPRTVRAATEMHAEPRVTVGCDHAVGGAWHGGPDLA